MKPFGVSRIPRQRVAKTMLIQAGNATKIGKNLSFPFFLDGSVVHSSSGSSVEY